MSDWPGDDPSWTHELRNAVNAMLLTTAVVRGLVERGDYTRSLEFVEELERACDRCRVLVSQLPGQPGSG